MTFNKTVSTTLCCSTFDESDIQYLRSALRRFNIVAPGSFLFILCSYVVYLAILSVSLIKNICFLNYFGVC